MNKKQVTALLKVLSKDTFRETLNHAYIDRYEGKLVMIATDGYKMALIYIDEDAAELEGRFIRRDALERWARAANAKSRLSGDELLELSRGDYGLHGGYYDKPPVPWKNIFEGGDTEAQTIMKFDGEFTKILQDVNGGVPLAYELYGANQKMVAKSDIGVFVLMPIAIR